MQASLRQESLSILRLAAPLMAAQGGHMLMGVVDAAVVGRVSALDMAAVALGNSVTTVVFTFGIGVGLGVEPLIGQAHGAGRVADAKAWLWQAVWLVLLLSVPIMLAAVGITFLLEPMGITPEMATRTTSYVLARLGSIPLVCLSVVARAYLSNIGRPGPALWATIFANIVNLVFDVALGLGKFGFPALGAVGVGWVTVVSMGLVVLVQSLAIARYWRDEPVSSKRFSPEKVRKILSLGWPVGLQLMVEVGIFAAVSALIGRHGTIPLAAHQVALSLASFTFMCAVGVANATTAFVGNYVGAGRTAEARRAGFLGIGLGGVFMGATGLVFIVFATELSMLFTNDAPVYSLGASLLRIAGVFAIGDGVQACAAGALRGAGDTRWTFYANTVAHWFIALPVALLLEDAAGLGVRGYWWGLTVGLVIVAITLTARFARLTARPIARVE